MRNLLHVLRHATCLASASPQLSRAAPTSQITFDFGCTRNLVTSAKLFAVGDSTRSGSLDLFDRQASYHGSYVAPTDLCSVVPKVFANCCCPRQLKAAHRDRAALLPHDEDPLLVNHLTA